jgi:hypothetical protein
MQAELLRIHSTSIHTVAPYFHTYLVQAALGSVNTPAPPFAARPFPLLVGTDSHRAAYPAVGPAMQFYSAIPELITRGNS